MQGLVVPSSMRLNVLGKIHQGHQGITKCRERSKAGVWWPGLSRQIEDVVTSCHKCIKCRVKPEPLIPSPVPDRPWQVLGTDLFELQSIDYLLVVDYFSKYVEIAPLLTTQRSLNKHRNINSGKMMQINYKKQILPVFSR